MKEVGQGGLQDKIVLSVEKQGGIVKKLNGAAIKGLPDLVIALPDFPLILAEVKYIGVKLPARPTYKVPLSPMQAHTMSQFNSRNVYNVVALTGINLPHGLCLYRTDTPLQDIDRMYSPYVIYEHGLGFDMISLLWGKASYGYARVRHT